MEVIDIATGGKNLLIKASYEEIALFVASIAHVVIEQSNELGESIERVHRCPESLIKVLEAKARLISDTSPRLIELSLFGDDDLRTVRQSIANFKALRRMILDNKIVGRTIHISQQLFMYDDWDQIRL